MNDDSIRPFHVLSLGICALFAQSIFLRELLSFVTGTELAVGLMIAAWLFWVGAGGIFGGRLVPAGTGRNRTRFVRLALAAGILVPATAVAIRFGRSILVRPPGEMPPLVPSILFSMLVMAPFGIVYGSLYNLASRLARRRGEDLPGGVSRVYIWEAAGTLVGAVVFSFVLLPLVSQLAAAFTAAFFLTAVVVSMLRTGRVWRFVAIVAVALVCIPAVPEIDRVSFSAMYSGYRVEEFRTSRYGEIVVLSREEMLSFFSGGGRLFSVPDTEAAEEAVHIPLLMHPAPRRVLMIGGSLGGGWEEALRHPQIERIDCLELDGELLDLALKILRKGGAAGPHAGDGRDRVRFIAGDGRFYLAGSEERYDVIIVHPPRPVSLQWNRFYTREFFELAGKSLRPGGMVAVSHPSSENYVATPLVRVLSSIRRTLGSVFGEVVLLPGATVHFIAGAGALDPDAIMPRLAERNIETRYISGDYLPHRFSKERIDFLLSSLSDGGDAALNTDAHPVLPYYELLLEGRRAGSSAVDVLAHLLDLPPALPVLIIAGIVLVLVLALRGGRAARLGVWIVGFGSFLYQLLVLMAYQSFSGHLYHAVVLLTALFMAGASAGAYLSHRSARSHLRKLRLVHFAFIVLALLLAGWFLALRAVGVGHTVGTAVFMVFSALGGVLTGLYYPIVVGMVLPREPAAVPAVFYAWDLFGACAGGLVGGLVLLPLTGVIAASLLIASVHLMAGVILVGRL